MKQSYEIVDCSRMAANTFSSHPFLQRMKGMPPTATHFLRKLVIAVVRFKPMSSNSFSASALRSPSIRMVNVVVIALFLSGLKNECIVSHPECGVNDMKCVLSCAQRARRPLSQLCNVRGCCPQRAA